MPVVRSGDTNSDCAQDYEHHPKEGDWEHDDLGHMPEFESDEEVDAECFNHRFWASDSSDDDYEYHHE